MLYDFFSYFEVAREIKLAAVYIIYAVKRNECENRTTGHGINMYANIYLYMYLYIFMCIYIYLCVLIMAMVVPVL